MDSGGVFLRHGIRNTIAYIMPMTAVPQRTAFSHACGALASALIGTAEYYKGLHLAVGLPKVVMVALIVETLLGFLTFTASMMAFGKLQEVLAQRPITYKGQNFVNLGVFAAAAGVGLALIVSPERSVLFPIFTALCAAVRRSADHPHRRRGYADGDRAVEFVCRVVG